MENKGFTTIILVVVIIFIGLWFLNSPKGAALVRDTKNNIEAKAAVYPAYYNTAAVYPAAYSNSNMYSNYPNSNYSASRAYITYPIARSSSSSQYVSSNYYYPPTTTASSSSYYYTSTPDPVVYQYPDQDPNFPENCYRVNFTTYCPQ
jgi:hypothetical protein